MRLLPQTQGGIGGGRTQEKEEQEEEEEGMRRSRGRWREIFLVQNQVDS
jgi:hypothetical protein